MFWQKTQVRKSFIEWANGCKVISMTSIGTTTGAQRSDGRYSWCVLSHDMSVSVAPLYHEGQSCPEQLYYYWSYHVVIQNFGHEAVRLLKRTWIITDGSGHVETVEGDGVVGEQPWIQPGGMFDYQSACPLRTPTGNMRGWYHFESESGKTFKARIPLFFLRTNETRH